MTFIWVTRHKSIDIDIDMLLRPSSISTSQSQSQQQSQQQQYSIEAIANNRHTAATAAVKLKHQSITTLQHIILQDWTGVKSSVNTNSESNSESRSKSKSKSNINININNGKGYYITGRLYKFIYRDDCLFDGPDPDMPVRGLAKYTGIASQLFEYRSSRADLLRPLEIDEENNTIKVSEGVDWWSGGGVGLDWWNGGQVVVECCGLVVGG